MNLLLQRIIGSSFAYYSRLIDGTINPHFYGRDRVLALIQNQLPIVWAGLHGQNRLASVIASYFVTPNEKPVCAIVAGDHRQVMMESYYRNIGFDTYAVGMEEDTFGGARELLRAIKDLKSGRIAYLFLAIDGPDGPALIPKPGVAYIAQRAEAFIIPVTFASPQAIQLKSRWDQMAIPVPFSDVYIYFGPSLAISNKMQIDEILSLVSESLRTADQKVKALAARPSDEDYRQSP